MIKVIFPKFVTKLSNELSKKWKISINTNGSPDLIPFFLGC